MSLDELMKIIHIVSSRAEETLAWRPIKSLDDLTKVNGMGAVGLKNIKAEGKAY